MPSLHVVPVIVEIAVVPVGTGSTSIGDYVRAVVGVISRFGYRYVVGPMGTSVELPRVEELGRLISEIHEELARMGVKRISTIVRIDDRRDREATMEYMVRRVLGSGGEG